MSTCGDLFIISKENEATITKRYLITHSAMVKYFGVRLQEQLTDPDSQPPTISKKLDALFNGNSLEGPFSIVHKINQSHPGMLIENNDDIEGGYTYELDFVRDRMMCQYQTYNNEENIVFYEGSLTAFEKLNIQDEESLRIHLGSYLLPSEITDASQLHNMCISDTVKIYPKWDKNLAKKVLEWQAEHHPFEWVRRKAEYLLFSNPETNLNLKWTGNPFSTTKTQEIASFNKSNNNSQNPNLK